MKKVKNDTNRMFIFTAALLLLGLPCLVLAETVLVEAESFTDLGGWVNDQQFMDQMGSPFLLAHGLGRPVEDAKTTIKIPADGKYRIWVRTRDWVAQWTKGKVKAPGQFQVVIDNQKVQTIFGTEGVKWHWQDGGLIDLQKGEVALKLHDLTGFEGRCDAILLCSEPDFIPPDDAKAAWRRKLLGIPDEPEIKGPYDLVVTGGGIAGITTSLCAARLGMKVALIHDRSVTGGNASPEVRVGLVGNLSYAPYPLIGSVTNEISWTYGKKRFAFNSPEKAAAYQVQALQKAGVDVYLNFRGDNVFMNKDRIVGIGATSTINSAIIRINGRWFADTTGDGCIGFMAGADYDIGIYHMGRTNLWNVIDKKKPTTFPRCPWAIDLTNKPFPGRKNPKWRDIPNFNNFFGWYWESGFKHDPFEKGEFIRDNNFRAMYGAWDCIKNVDKSYPTYDISYACWISGKRESRRLMGDVILSAGDISSNKTFEDGVVPLSWPMDFHFPHAYFFDYQDNRKDGFHKWPFISDAPDADHRHFKVPYWIPYRTLYSRNISNLFMAGRDISVTQEALGSVRVQTTTGMMGEIVGMAASICKKHNTTPRGVYQNHLNELKTLLRKGVGKSSDTNSNVEKF